MHELNTSNLIGFDFYLQPQASSTKRLEYIFNKLYGVLPTTVSFSDEFETTCLEDIQKYFELECKIQKTIMRKESLISYKILIIRKG
jgi:hypothetical protein